MKQYKPSEIEPKWQRIRGRKPLFPAVDFSQKKKFYALVEFPYPSGEGLHMGHAFTCTILDVFTRKKRMEGLNLLYPMGWDAFGLPTENYAIKTGIHPAVVTRKNTNRFRSQMKRLGLAYNWEREVNTTDPDYYRWTQWVFLQLFKHGLAYKAEMPVGWCPACKIILANEEIVGGACERCGHQAERRMQTQWLLRITAYADRLADELDLVDYPDYVKTAQRNWIGRSEGVEEYWPVEGMDLKLPTFTTWPHTSWGATFIVSAPEHPVINDLVAGTKYEKKAKEFCQKIIQEKIKDPLSTEKEKKGFFTGREAINHLTGEKMPIFIANFAVMEYGTGIVKGCPAHDARDFEFAKKYNLKIQPVIKGKKKTMPYIGEGVMINAGPFTGMATEKAREAITDQIIKSGNGKRVVNYHLRDWIFSRQRYWGEPIPMVYCPKCARLDPAGQGWVPVPEKDLPVKLPQVEKYQPTETGESPLASVKDWVKVACPECGGAARRETDTMPNWAGSSWYFLRYCDPKNKRCLADPQKLKYWMPVDLYLGGAEHTTLHLLYSRFWHKFLNDIGVAPGKEPYQARRQHGVILGEDGFRMSKSRGNVINPEDVVEKFGADTLRLYLLFMGPYDQTMSWSTTGVEGCWRFLNRVWQLFQKKEKIGKKSDKKLVRQLHQLIKKVGEDIESLKHNTAIAAMMEFLNSWSGKEGNLSKKEAGIFLQLLAPFAPYITEELWHEFLGKKSSIHQQKWPKYEPKLAKEEMITIIVQINGKLRERLIINHQSSIIKSEIEKLAKESPKVQKHLQVKKIKKVIFVPGRLINFVTN